MRNIGIERYQKAGCDRKYNVGGNLTTTKRKLFKARYAIFFNEFSVSV